ncbi:MAG TPA: hypothetical protein VLG11_04475 [Candidatus Saccharimonadales bacterium]|nr:hypothetical protein [Candidatus Saccharimonadales bacterium]
MPPEEQRTPSQVTTPGPVQPASTPPMPASDSAATQPGVIQPGAAGHSSNAPLIVSIVVVLLLIIAALVAGWFTIWSPAAESAHTANAFMKAISSGDTQKAETLSADQSADGKKFIEESASSLKGTFKLSQSSFQQEKRYSLYSSSDAAKKNARLIVIKQDGKWLVDSLVFSNNSLKLVPDSSSQTSTSTTTTAGSDCLVPGDYSVLTSEVDGLKTNTTAWTANGPYTNNVHFLTDSLSYDTTDEPENTIKGFADFYSSNKTKSFKIHLQGNVATTAAADLSFANQRAQKVSSDLQADGVPAASIVVDAPGNVTNSVGNAAPNATDQSSARNVVLQIIPTCSSDKTSSNR